MYTLLRKQLEIAMTLEQTLGDESQVNQETNAVLTQKEGVQQEVVTNLTILPLQIQKADSIKSP